MEKEKKIRTKIQPDKENKEEITKRKENNARYSRSLHKRQGVIPWDMNIEKGWTNNN